MSELWPITDEASLRASHAKWEDNEWVMGGLELTKEEYKRLHDQSVSIERAWDAHPFVINEFDEYVLKEPNP